MENKSSWLHLLFEILTLAKGAMDDSEEDFENLDVELATSAIIEED